MTVPVSLTCRICGNAGPNKAYLAKEMLLGTRDEFEYFECSNCGCLQIKEIPPDTAKYYPAEYQPFNSIGPKGNFIRRFLKKKMAASIIDRKGIIGRLAPLVSTLPPILPELSKCQALFDSRILDVGCGNGRLLMRLKEWGFSNLTGVDLYVQDKIASDCGVKIIKGEISALTGKYDVIMLHHSFEHMPEPLKTLNEIHRLLNPDGCALIRMPTVSSYAWRHYGINWLGLGAPRHFFLHSLKSMELLASQSGFRIKEIVFNSTRNQFWGSEQFLKGTPFNVPTSYACNRRKSIFTRKQLRSFGKQASQLNAQRQGDQISVYLTPLKEK